MDEAAAADAETGDRNAEGSETGLAVLLPTIRGDFTQAAGFLVIGAAAAATLNTLVPRQFMVTVGSSVFLSILVMGVLAFFLAICSESDAFVAASFSTIPVVGKLVFLTVGPAIDIKLFAMQSGTFGRKFAVRFAPLTFVVAVLVARRYRPVVLRRLAVNRTTQSVLIALLGGLMISITVSGRYTSYVKPSYGPLLIISGIVLILVGVLSIVVGIRSDLLADRAREARTRRCRWRRRRRDDGHEHQDHDDDRTRTATRTIARGRRG